MNILMTGGLGFIGSHFLRLLSETTNYNVVNLDKLTYAGNLKNVQDLPYETIIGDVINEELVRYLVKKNDIDTIIHAAAETHVDRSIKNPKAFLETDIMGLFNLIKIAKDNNVKRIIITSTDETYGPTYEEKTEDDVLNPTSPYSSSKASGDLIAMAYYKTYGLPIIIVRPSNNYGTHQYPEKLIPMSITRLLDKKKILLHGDGSEIREWINVKDCVLYIKAILENGIPGQIYNIGSGLRYTNLTIITNIVNLMTGCRGCAVNNYIDRIPNRPGNDFSYAVSMKKTRELLNGTIYSSDMRKELSHIIKWYKNNRDWWENVDIESNIYTDEYLR